MTWDDLSRPDISWNDQRSPKYKMTLKWFLTPKQPVVDFKQPKMNSPSMTSNDLRMSCDMNHMTSYGQKNC